MGAIVTIAALVLALTPPAQLELIGQAIEQLDYAEAQRLSRILLADPTASADHLVQAHLHAGGCSVVLDDEVAARAHFNAALRARPASSLPSVWATTPKVVVVFDEVSSELSVTQARAASSAQGTLLTTGALALGGAAVWGGGLVFQGIYRDLTRPVQERQYGRGLGVSSALLAMGLWAGAVGVALSERESLLALLPTADVQDRTGTGAVAAGQAVASSTFLFLEAPVATSAAPLLRR